MKPTERNAGMQENLVLSLNAADEQEYTREREWFWIQEAQANPQAFGSLYDLYYDRIFRYLYRLCGRRAHAEDLTADTFFKAMHSLGRYRPQSAPFQSWLYRIAYNEFVNQYRKERVRRLFGLRTRREAAALDPVVESAAHEVEMQCLQETISGLMRQLKPCDQALLALRYFEDLPIAEAARVVGLAEPNARSRIHRALEKLKDIIEKEAPDMASWIQGVER